MNRRSSPSPSAEELQVLAIQVRQLHEEARLLRMAIDDLRDDVVWAARNCLQTGYLPTGLSHASTKVASAVDEEQPAPLPVTSSPQGSSGSPTRAMESSPPLSHARGASTVETTEPAAAPPVRPVLSEAKKGPLHMRLYFHEPLTAVARAIGYDEVTPDEWQRRLTLLHQRHDPVLIAAAVRDLIEQTPDQRIRLKTRLHSIAVGLLGRPKLKEPTAPLVPPDQANSTPSPPEPIPEPISRHLAIEQFLKFLQERGVAYTVVNGEFRRRYPEQSLSRLDLVLPDGAANTLVTVQNRLTKKLRREAASWLAALGPARVLRVWPYRLGAHLQWQEETVEPLEQADA